MARDVEGAPGHRQERLEQILEEELASLVRDEARDPRLSEVTVTRVELSVDYRNARVFFVSAGDEERVARALERAAPFLRARLVDLLDIKQVPQLRFLYDRAAETG